MDSSNIQLFSGDANKVVLPSLKQESPEGDSTTLISESINKDISGETVKIIRVKEDTEIEENNYIIDLSNIGQVTASQKDVIKSLISKYGNTAIYLYKKQGLIKLGMGDKYSLERIFPIIRSHVFDNEIRIYKNFKVGENVEEIDTKDITKLRLRL